MKEQNMENEKKPGFLERFIHRPVMAWVINIVIALVGAVAWQQLPIRELPKMTFPHITVKTEFPGASPSIVESQITVPLEEAFAGIEGLDFMTSTSSNGQSAVYLNFKNTRDIDAAAADVRDRMARAKDSFPQERLRDPIISKSSSDETELIQLVAVGPKYSLAKIADYMERYAKSTLESISGVAAVHVSGGGGGGDSGAFRIHALVNPEKLHALDLTIREIHETIHQSSFKKPLGEIVNRNIAYTVTLDQAAKCMEDYANIILKQHNNGFVRLSDVAELKLITDDPESKLRVNGHPCVSLSVVPQYDSNPLATAKEVREKLDEIKRSLPKDLKLDILRDGSEPIQKSLNSVYWAIFEAIIFVFFVMLFFLRSLRSTFIPMITIPICILGGFFIIFLCKFSINILTLLAIVLAIGLVVDDAIVVLENIYRHIEKGIAPLKAAIMGIKEIQFAVVAMTMTLMAVYIPITLSSGLVGKLFIEFAVTLAGTVLISGIVALVLTPMLCSRLLKEHAHTQALQSTGRLHEWNAKIEHFLMVLDQKYDKFLDIAIKNTKNVIIGCVSLGALAIGVALYLPKMLTPETDGGYIVLSFEAPSGANANYIDKYAQKIEKTIKGAPMIKDYIISVRSKSDHNAIYIILVDKSKRKKTSHQILADITKLIDPVQSGLHVHGRAPSGMISMGGSGDTKRVSFTIQTQKSYDEMELLVQKLIRMLMTYPGVNPNSFRTSRVSPERAFNAKINEQRAAQLNVHMHDLGEMLSFVMRGQPPADRFDQEGKRYPMIVTISEDFKKDPENIKRFHIRAFKTNESNRERHSYPLVSLHELISITETRERPMAVRYDGMRSYEIIFDLKKGSPIKVYNNIAKTLDRMLPIGYTYSPTGTLRQTIKEGKNVSLIFMLSILFIFLIMAAQFESFIDPLMIMLSVPLALAGGVLTLFVVPDASLNIFTYIALITLIGLITKHGILIVDFANKKFANEKRTRENLIKAAKEASALRLRPILMTTSAMVLGALPLALARGYGKEINSQIGWVVVGGMIIGTMFTVFLIPCIYVLVNTWKMRWKGEKI